MELSLVSFIGIEKEMYDKAEETEGGWRTFKEFAIADKVSKVMLLHHSI